MRSRTLFALLPFALSASALVSPIHRRVVGFPNTHTKPYKVIQKIQLCVADIDAFYQERALVNECQIGGATVQDPAAILENIRSGNAVPAQLGTMNTEDILGALTSCLGSTFAGLPGPPTRNCRIGDEVVVDPSTLLNSILDGTVTAPYGIDSNTAIIMLQGCISNGVGNASQDVPVGGSGETTTHTDTELTGLPTLDSLVGLTPLTSSTFMGTPRAITLDQPLGGSTGVSPLELFDRPQSASGESASCEGPTLLGMRIGVPCITPSATHASVDAQESETSDVTPQVGNATPVKGGLSRLFGGTPPVSGLTGGLPFLSGSGLFGSSNLPLLNDGMKHTETNGLATGPLNYEGQDSGTISSDRGRVAQVSAPEVSPAGASVDSTNAPVVQPAQNEIAQSAAPLADGALDAVDQEGDSLGPVDGNVADACVSDSEEACQ